MIWQGINGKDCRLNLIDLGLSRVDMMLSKRAKII